MTIDHCKVKTIAKAYTAAWNSGSAEAVAEFYAEDGRIVINCGEPCVVEMAAGFFADVPDLTLACDELRCAGDHAVHLWTFTGTHSGTKNHQRVVGWEQLDLDTHCKVKASRGWYETRTSASDGRRANEAPYHARSPYSAALNEIPPSRYRCRASGSQGLIGIS